MSAGKVIQQKHTEQADRSKLGTTKLSSMERVRYKPVNHSLKNSIAEDARSHLQNETSSNLPSRIKCIPKQTAKEEQSSNLANVKSAIKRPKGNPDSSFDAEDNENELLTANEKKKKTSCQTALSHVIAESTTAGIGNLKPVLHQVHHMTNKSIAKDQPREHFELEMHKHGLFDKIAHIQQLKNYFEVELGGNKKAMMDSSRSIEENKAQPQLPVPQPQNSSQNVLLEKGYAFPFQKRARSNSPPRNGTLFGGKSGEESPNEFVGTVRKPVMARTNFVMGKDLSRMKDDIRMKIQFADHSSKALENEDAIIDCCGLSTGPTDELQKVHTIEDDDSDWMYQRIGNNNEENEEDVMDEGSIGGVDSGAFLKLLSSTKFNS